MSTELLERYDGYAGIRKALGVIAKDKGEWAGIPLSLEGQPLIVDKKYPYAKILESIQKDIDKDRPLEEIVPSSPDMEGARKRGEFWSTKLRSSIVLIEKKDGHVCFGVSSGVHHFKLDLMTMGASIAWGIEQESNALQLLATLLPHNNFKQYLLTGMFLESSRRSSVTYCFRRLRPTVALTMNPEPRILCTLCLHPIAYYSGSWAGAMCPTDDVIAHLMLMRGDEHMFWRRGNQHPAYRPEAGL